MDLVNEKLIERATLNNLERVIRPQLSPIQRKEAALALMRFLGEKNLKMHNGAALDITKLANEFIQIHKLRIPWLSVQDARAVFSDYFGMRSVVESKRKYRQSTFVQRVKTKPTRTMYLKRGPRIKGR